jgi:hypothetical protein
MNAADAFVAPEIGSDEARGFCAGNAQRLAEPTVPLTVNHPEIHGLCSRPVFARELFFAQLENFERGTGVNVLAGAKSVQQHRILRQMREDAQLDLRVIRAHEHVAGGRDERLTDLASELGANGNVLQIRVGRRQASGGRHGLFPGRMDAAGAGVQEQRQSIDVCAFQLAQLANLENHFG